jgi:hypothetical protein
MARLNKERALAGAEVGRVALAALRAAFRQSTPDDHIVSAGNAPRWTSTTEIKQPTKLPDDLASAIAAGAPPVGDSVILVYRGKLYVLPDKQVQGGHTATHMVMGAAGAPVHGD